MSADASIQALGGHSIGITSRLLRCRRQPSSEGKAFPRGQTRRPVNPAGEAKESLSSLFCLGTLKLTADDSTHRQSCPLRHFLQPGQKLVCNTNCQCTIHLPLF